MLDDYILEVCTLCIAINILSLLAQRNSHFPNYFYILWYIITFVCGGKNMTVIICNVFLLEFCTVIHTECDGVYSFDVI